MVDLTFEGPRPTVLRNRLEGILPFPHFSQIKEFSTLVILSPFQHHPSSSQFCQIPEGLSQRSSFIVLLLDRIRHTGALHETIDQRAEIFIPLYKSSLFWSLFGQQFRPGILSIFPVHNCSRYKLG
jgi:hypothetical protein